jgi:hypothetical protein
MKIFSCLAILFFLSRLPVHAGEKPEHRKVAEYYAPAIYQEAKSAVLDFITKFDFDGDWNGADNWRNAYRFELPAYVYYAVIESTGHYFITYAFFHPRDYSARPMEGYGPKTEHENDMEGCTLTVEKGGGQWGKPILLETLAHDHFYKYDNPQYTKVASGTTPLDGSIVFMKTEGAAQREPALFIEGEGHGVKAASRRETDLGQDFPGVIYRFLGRGAQVPRSHLDKDVSYELVSIEDSLWAKRLEIGEHSVYCCAEEYLLPDGKAVRIGSSFNGPIGSCSAKPPWGWAEAKAGPIKTGDWFRDPVFAYNQQLKVEGLSGNYLHNPYLSIDSSPQASQTGHLCAETPESKNVKEAVTSTLLGVGKVLLSEGLNKQRVGDRAKQLFLSGTVLLEWASKSDFERWDWNKTLSKERQPALETENFIDQMRIPLLQNFSFNSPIFRAPTRYFDSLVMKYRCAIEGAKAKFYWRYEDMEDFDESHSQVMNLRKSDRWVIDALDLSKSDHWDRSKTLGRLKVEILSPSNQKLGTLNPASAQGKSNQVSDQVIVNYIVFDRDAFAYTFER